VRIQELSDDSVHKPVADELKTFIVVGTRASVSQRTHKQRWLLKFIANGPLQGGVLWFQCKGSQFRLPG
jgi:hypothetical protein